MYIFVNQLPGFSPVMKCVSLDSSLDYQSIKQKLLLFCSVVTKLKPTGMLFPSFLEPPSVL